MNRLRSLSASSLLFVLTLVAGCADRTPGLHVSPVGHDVGDCHGAPCATISYAVRQARPGDTISVGSGTYHESVLITKRVMLVGHNATIDAAGKASPANGVMISGDSAAGTRVAGFTIRNAGLEGIYVLATSNVTIANNMVVNSDAYGRSNPLCTKYEDDCGEAIHLQAVHGSIISGNTVRQNLGGILLTDETGPTHDNTIDGNTLADNPHDCGITLASHWTDSTAVATPEVAGVYRNTVTNNNVTGSGGAGIGVFAAAVGGAAWGNVVEGNTSSKNLFAGLMIHGHAKFQNLDDNVFRNNTLAGNGTDALNPADKEPAGISLYSAVVPIRNTVITGNRVSDEHYGVIAQNVDPLGGFRSNTFASSVAVPVSAH